MTKASADELRAVWGPFGGEAGTYEVTNGNQITMRPITAKNPAATGALITYSYRLDGDTLWLTQQRTGMVRSRIQSQSKPCASNDERIRSALVQLAGIR